MATTTPNFGWDVPQSTDLVKDGATAIAALGNDIDTSLVDLKGGTTGQVLSKASNTDMDFTWSSVDPLTILDAKGDLISATAADTPARLAVGADGTYLQADSTTSTGLKWGSVSAGAYTSLATGTLSSTEVSITSISSAYTDLYLIVNNPYVNSASPLTFRVNNNSTADYCNTQMDAQSSTLVNQVNVSYLRAGNGNLPTSTSSHFYYLYIRSYANSLTKTYVMGGANASNQNYFSIGGKTLTAAISSIQIRTQAGTPTFSGGTYTLYGVK